MGYCNKTQLTHHLGDQLEILLRESGKDVTNDQLLSIAITRADAEIDSYLHGRYPVPLSLPIPNLIFDLSLDIATYKLAARRGKVADSYKDAYKNAKAALKEIQGGRSVPGLSNSVAIPIRSSTQGVTKTFTRDSLKDF